jgi:signal transduction histidine kinase
VLLHMTVLAISLVTFPRGWPRGWGQWVLVVLAVPVGLLLVTQPWISSLFVAVALAGLVSWRSGAVASPYSCVAGLGVAAALGASWLAERHNQAGFDPTLAVRNYELVLLAVAACYPLAARAVERDRSRLTDRVLADTGPAGLEGLVGVLRDVLRDPNLALRVMPDLDDVAIESRSSALADPQIADAVSSAVRLTVENGRLQDELAGRLVELQAARTRFLDAVDDQRVLTAARLRADVLSPVARATSVLSQVARSAPQGEGVDAARVAVEELATASDEIMALVGGVAPAELGGGRLAGVIESFVEHSPIPVVVTTTPAAAGSIEVESTLFYVAAEALTNALKHAGASRIVVTIDGDDRSVAMSISDDGCGGADFDGSGLQGVADRLAARNGRLRVDSPLGIGTRLRATVPR